MCRRVLPAFLFALTTAQAASLVAYISAPHVMSSSVVGTTTETFNSSALLGSTATTYHSVLGDYTVPNGYVLPVIAADSYGGAGNSQYMYVGSRKAGDATTVTLSLATQVNYFGFWWSAGDAKNRLSLYVANTLIATFQTDDIINLLKNATVTAVDGTTVYSSSAYYGNPNAGPNAGKASGEPFAYVSLVATGFSFDRIVFDNNGSSGFENDNHSVYAGIVDVPKDYLSFVEVANVDFVNTPVPEPGTLAMAGMAAVVWAVVRHRASRRP